MPSSAFWRHFLKSDPFLLQAGAAGELMVARIRMLLTVTLLTVPSISFLANPRAREHYVGFGVTLFATMVAAAVYFLVRRDMYRPWVGVLTTIFDVSLITCILAIFLFLTDFRTAVNSEVVFEAYFLAIGATTLRYDARICLLAGLLAIVQYAGIVIYATVHWDLSAASFAPPSYGMFTWTVQVSRIILLGVATVLATAVVVRAQSLRRLSAIDRLTRRVQPRLLR